MSGASVRVVRKEEVTLRAGFMSKKGGIRKNWQRRWFVLYSTTQLVYYVDDDCATRKGVIELSDVTSVRKSTAPSCTYHHEIEIETPDRTWQLRTETAEELEGWAF